ncbi:hypothetical protein [Profundibacter sp.]
MKRILAAFSIALITATNVAFAMPPTAAQTDMIHRYAPMADVPALSDKQIHDLMAIIQSNDSENSKRIRAGLVLQRSGGLIWN